MIDNPRLRHVLEMVQDRSGLSRPRQLGHGFGAACSSHHGTYIAEVAEVTVSSRREGKVERAWAAVDAVRLVHPDRERNQIESGIQQPASWTLHEDLKHYGSEVTTTSWRGFTPSATFRDALREIDVIFTGKGNALSTGTGDRGSVPAAAALANAVYDACSVRVRRLSLTPVNLDPAR